MQIARLSIPVKHANGSRDSVAQTTDLNQICELINLTHNSRTFFIPYAIEGLGARLNRVPSYNKHCFYTNDDAVIGLWQVNETNTLTHNNQINVLKVDIVLDYGFKTLDGFMDCLQGVCKMLQDTEATHISIVCDTRADEYHALKNIAEDVQQFVVHTLPWNLDDFSRSTVYCDAIYV